MNAQRIVFVASLLLVGLLLGACAPDVDDAVQATLTRIEEEKILTSAVSAVATSTPTPPPAESQPTPTTATTAPVPDDTATPAPTDTPASEPVGTLTPTPTATLQRPTPTPTEEKLAIAQSPVAGNDGNDFLRGPSTSNQGRIVLLPSFAQSEVTEPVVFRDRLVFQVEVFDTRVALSDGAGIRDVTFRIEPDDGSGQVVHENVEQVPPYCVFGGGEYDCNVLTFAASDPRWPAGGEIVNGLYLARIDIVAANGEKTQWRWRFIVEIPGQPDYNTARIVDITVQEGRYIVDFETFGFEPLVPGQHVHFFFDTVPPEQAGLPGKGPWQIYPTGAGQPNVSPFTLYNVGQRPPNATRMCVLVANPDHSVNLGSGNCVDLP